MAGDNNKKRKASSSAAAINNASNTTSATTPTKLTRVNDNNKKFSAGTTAAAATSRTTANVGGSANSNKKKEGTTATNKNNNRKKDNDDDDDDCELIFDKPLLSLEDIQRQMKQLCKRLPNVESPSSATSSASAAETSTRITTTTEKKKKQEQPTNDNNNNEDSQAQIQHQLDYNNVTQIFDFASDLQSIIEEFNLLVCCISSSTYNWSSEKSGIADQNLSTLSSEISDCQDHIASAVTPRLTNVLAPVVDLVVDKTITKTTTTTTMTKNNNDNKNKDNNNNNNNNDKEGEEANSNNKDEKEETKQNYYTQKYVDPQFNLLCRKILVRNAYMMIIVMKTNFIKAIRCINDYLNASKKDLSNYNDYKSGFMY